MEKWSKWIWNLNYCLKLSIEPICQIMNNWGFSTWIYTICEIFLCKRNFQNCCIWYQKPTCCIIMQDVYQLIPQWIFRFSQFPELIKFIWSSAPFRKNYIKLSKNLRFYFTGVWLSSFNSVANPFVYALLMPTYRKCVINTFCTCVKGSNRSDLQENVSPQTSEISQTSTHKHVQSW